MVSLNDLLCQTLTENKFWQGIRVTNDELPYERDNDLPSGSFKCEEQEELQKDLAELLLMLHVAERPSVKEVIQADIDVTPVKMESLKDFRNQFETKISWARVATLQHNKSKYKKQKVACPLQITSNRYNLLCNDTNDDDDDDNDNTPTNLSKLRKPTTSHVKRERKKNHKKRSVENKVHKVLMLGDSHTRGCASKVRNQLNNEYEVSEFINPGSEMKNIKESAKTKMTQLTNDDIVVLWRGSNDVTRKNSVVGMKHILDLLIHSSHTNVILLSVPQRHDLISDSCVNREVEAFNSSL
jgi:hypothetical protein